MQRAASIPITRKEQKKIPEKKILEIKVTNPGKCIPANASWLTHPG